MRKRFAAVLVSLFLLTGFVSSASATDPVVERFVEAWAQASRYALQDSLAVQTFALQPAQIYQASVNAAAETAGIQAPALSQNAGIAKRKAMTFLRATLQAIPDRMRRNELFRAALRGMLSPWDFWARALSPVEHDMALSFFGFYEEGTGVIIGRKGDDYVVRKVLRAMGGERAGIRVGDVVLAINNVGLGDITGIMWLRMEREARRTGRIQYTIRRRNVVSHLDVEWARRFVPEVISQMLADDIGYIALRSRFMLGTGHEILEAVERLTAQGARSFIVDLRQNPGGSTWEMQIAISTFMRGALYIFRGPIFGNRIFFSVVARPTDAGMAILVDSRSASAAEIFAFTLRNRPHTRIFGSDALTSGKGTGQSLYMLANGWMFSFTTVRIFDANGETHDNRGVAPHEVVTPLPDEAARGLSTADAIVQRAIAWLREQ